MTAVPVLVIAGRTDVHIGPLAVWERAALTANRVRLAPIAVWSPTPTASKALSKRNVPLAVARPDAGPFSSLDPARAVIVIGPDVIVDGPSLIALSTEAARSGESQAIVVRDAGVPALLFLPAGCVAAIQQCESLSAAVAQLAATGAVRELITPDFVRHLRDAATARGLERDLVRHLNGAAESFFTKIIRRSSVPLSIRLARLGVSPTLVTLGGLVLAIVSAWCISRGRYGYALAGALCYYASMVFDCADGEVARLSVRDSDFGAWFETAVDYTTYVLLLGALTIAVRHEPGGEAFETDARVAAVGSLVIAVVAIYLRQRVAGADPGRFDESSAAALKSAGGVHRFARWGRQWIKRSTIAHLVVLLALMNQLKALLLLWAFGAALGSVVIITVAPFLVHRVPVTPRTVAVVPGQPPGTELR